MIGANIEIDPASRRKMEETLRRFEQATKKTAEDGINMIAFSSGRRLVNTVQPYGMNKGAEQIGNIGRQIDQTFYMINAGIIPGHGAMLDIAHNRLRGRTGKVQLKSMPATDRYREIVSIAELNTFKRKQQAKAGRIKAAWVSAVNKIGAGKMSKIPQWIARHGTSKYGNCIKTGKGMQYQVELENVTPYMTSRLQNNRDILAAAADGLKNGMKRIRKIIDKEIEKANRATQ